MDWFEWGIVEVLVKLNLPLFGPFYQVVIFMNLLLQAWLYIVFWFWKSMEDPDLTFIVLQTKSPFVYLSQSFPEISFFSSTQGCRLLVWPQPFVYDQKSIND